MRGDVCARCSRVCVLVACVCARRTHLAEHIAEERIGALACGDRDGCTADADHRRELALSRRLIWHDLPRPVRGATALVTGLVVGAADTPTTANAPSAREVSDA
jgi:hypothetical protein